MKDCIDECKLIIHVSFLLGTYKSNVYNKKIKLIFKKFSSYYI